MRLTGKRALVTGASGEIGRAIVARLIREGAQVAAAGRAQAKLEALAKFTAHMHDSRGLPTKDEVAAFKAAGFGDVHIYEIILAMSVKTLSNYANHIQHTEVDAVFSAFQWDLEPA